MQTITTKEQIADLKDNQIIGNFDFINSKVIFKGSGNILITPNVENHPPTILDNTTITFNNNNSVVFLDKSNKCYSLNLEMFNNNFCYIGSDNYFNGTLYLQCSEQCNIFIANNCLFSFGVWFRTSDVHLIYDVNTHKRVNHSKSIFIGDHVWIGQDAKIWKGTQIGSGAIIGASSFTTGKKIPSNTVWGGNPAKLLKKDVFFHGISTHPFTNAETEKWNECDEDKYIYKFDENETLNFIELEKKIIALPTAQERLDFLLNFSKSTKKNRFYI